MLHGVSPDILLSEIIGNKDGICGGKARSMGFIDHPHHFYISAIVGGMCASAVGVAWALKRKQEQDPLYGDVCDFRPRVWCFIGDGALDGGHFWESLHYAEGHDLPIKFVVEDNDRATKTPWEPRNGKGIDRRDWVSNKVIYYSYLPKYGHVGTGKYVQF